MEGEDLKGGRPARRKDKKEESPKARWFSGKMVVPGRHVWRGKCEAQE